MAEKIKFSPLAVCTYLTLALFLVLGMGRLIAHEIEGHMDPDKRNANEMAEAFLKRRKKSGLLKGEVTPELIRKYSENGQCLLQKMGILECAEKEDEANKGCYKQKEQPNRGDGVIWHYGGRGGTLPDELNNKGVKYEFHSNVFGFVRVSRFENITNELTFIRQHELTKEGMEWLTMSNEEFLSSLLRPVHKWDGSEMLDKEDRPCELLAPLARMVTVANRKMHRMKKGELIPLVCTRSTLSQAMAFVDKYGCDATAQGEGVMPPGNSHHAFGLAMDLANQEQAAPFLAEIGMACGFIGGDEGHCSLAENSLRGNLLKAVGLRVQMLIGEAGEVWEIGKELWKMK
ncbi:MAG: hypothetical protein OEY44_04525 [Candidatus Peregrinibacteria bacterium]|nr:hypothetical protein [Candidatus Peregrinibacteria bacterium]